MTPKEQFNEWWIMAEHNFHALFIEPIAREAFLKGYLLGQKQGMEESAKICDSLNKYRSDNHCIEHAAEAIRQAANALKEIK